MGRKPRVLALHSFRTSATIFDAQLRLAGLKQALGNLVEFTFLDAPHAASGEPYPDVAAAFPGEAYFEWWDAQRVEGGGYEYRGAAASLAAVAAALLEAAEAGEPFDAICGFSQGAAIAALAAAEQRAGRGAAAGTPPLRFALLFAGLRSRDPALDPHYAALPGLPSLHVVGAADPVRRASAELLEAFREGSAESCGAAPELLTHARGHVIPRLIGEDLERMRAFVGTHAGGGEARL
jgi:predicted esterase